MARAVVVGAGGISNAWFPPLKQENVEILGVVDLDVRRAEEACQRHELQCLASDNLDEVLRSTNPDFVVDLTVPEAHCEVTCTALNAGCHVVGEKPMASSLDEARRMIEAAERNGRMFMVGQSRRWAPLPATLAAAVQSGQIGRVTAVDCQFFLGMHFGGFREQMESPLILDMGIHHFDLARFITGCEPETVVAHEYKPHGSWYRGDCAASCVFQMTGGVLFTYTGSWCSTGCDSSWHGNWRVVGEYGSVLFENDQLPRGERAGDEPVERGPTSKNLVPVTVAPVDMPKQGQHGALDEMLRFLDTGALPQTECHDNVRSLAMVFNAIRSSKTRAGLVPVNPLAPSAPNR